MFFRAENIELKENLKILNQQYVDLCTKNFKLVESFRMQDTIPKTIIEDALNNPTVCAHVFQNSYGFKPKDFSHLEGVVRFWDHDSYSNYKVNSCSLPVLHILMFVEFC